MSINTNCHDTIVGITRKAITIPDYIEEYSLSKSDLFLDELQGIVLAEQCDSQVWEMALRSRQKAWQQLRHDIAATMEDYAENVRQNKNIDVGSRDFLTRINTGALGGLRLYSNLKGLSMTLKSISIFPNFTGNVDIKVIDDDGTELISATVAVTIKKEYKYTLPIPAIIPLSGNLLILASTPGTCYSQKLGCCGSTASYFDTDRPSYNDRDSRIWRRWAMATGVTGDVPTVDNLTLRKGTSAGLTINATFTCDDYDMLCSDDSDFISDKTDRAIAFAFLYLWAEQFLAEITGTGEINRYIMLGFEAIENNVKYYQERYNEILKYIAANIDYTRTECWTCRKKYTTENRFKR